MNKVNLSKHFLILKNKQKEQKIDLEATTYSIGRAIDNLIVINDPKISRYHATLLRIISPTSDTHQFRIIDGDLNRKRSKNGIRINGNFCFSHDLQHNDTISFCEHITATYNAVVQPQPKTVLESYFSFEEDEDIDFTATVNNLNRSLPISKYHSVDISHVGREASIQQSLERLASFPELFSDPIIEIDLKGNITYINPAALKCFPTLRENKLNHPILKEILTLVRAVNKKSFVREVKIENKIFEQSIHLISASQLVRCYISDITKKKAAEVLLRRNHKELELRVQERTSELVYKNEILQLEITERKQKEQEIILLQTITQAITKTSSFNDAIAITLQQVCETVNWDFGEAWIPDAQTKLLKLSPAFHTNTEKFDYYREVSQKIYYPKEVGQAGRVWATQKSEWIEDISQQEQDIYLRSKIAKVVGIKMALAVPMIANKEVIAVLIFYDSSTQIVNQKTIKLIESVAVQLGLIIERKKAEDALISSMATNKAILDAIPDLILRLNRNGTLVNYKAAKVSSLLSPSPELLGKHISKIFNQEISQSIANSIEEVFKTSEVEILECQILNQEKTRSYEIRIAISEVNEVMAIVRDITNRKQAEEDIRRTLEQEKKLNELKSRFVTMTSHEFRTPLASILSSSELLEHYSHKWSEEKIHNHLNRIQESVKHMTELLNDVLLLGKADAEKLAFKPSKIDVLDFCRKLVEEFELTISTHKISFKCLENNNNQTVACVDERIFKHIIYNLLSNAVKYSPECDSVDFELSCQPQQTILKVRDFGIGISAENQKQLFESFYRADNVGSIPGTGLGLPIVKKSVDLHGGTISVNSEIDRGSLFTVIIPHHS